MSAIENKSTSLKQHLLESVRNEKADFLSVANDFYNQPHRTDENYMQFCRDTIASIDKILEAGDWNSSLFLRNTAKPLVQLRERAQEILTKMTGGKAQDVTANTVPEGMQLVYVSLFQAKGHDLERWEMQLRSLYRYMSGRPVYSNEADVEAVIRAKVSPDADAYVVLAIPDSAIRDMSHAVPRKDRQGHELVTLKEGVVNSEHIVEFVHAGKRYRFANNKLKVK